ncbi:MAG TPA: hypothetical protein VFN63_16320 [Pseudolabrys sp.]|nr:hypothetical protein [Pseudolabrys sp.]
MIFSIQSSVDHPSLCGEHCRKVLSVTVNRFTGGTQIRHFVMAITVECPLL